MPIAVVAKTFGIVALRKDFPARTVQEFIAYAKANPGKINLGHAGIGSSNFLICRSFVHAAGIEVTLVGYRGAAPALTDAIGGQIDGVCDAAASVSQAIHGLLLHAPAVVPSPGAGSLQVPALLAQQTTAPGRPHVDRAAQRIMRSAVPIRQPAFRNVLP